MGMIPKSTKNESMLFMGLSVIRIILVIGTLLLSYEIFEQRFDSEVISICCSLLCGVIAFILSGKSPTNPKISFAKGLSYFIFHFIEPKQLYGDETEEFRNFERMEAKRNVKKTEKRRKKAKKEA